MRLKGNLSTGCNNKINGIGFLSSLTDSSSSVNVMDIFNSAARCRQIHDYRHYTSPILWGTVMTVIVW